MRPYPALLLLLATTAVQAEQDCTAPVTQTDMNICAFQDYQRADAKLNAAYKKRVASLEKAQLERLRTVSIHRNSIDTGKMRRSSLDPTFLLA